jgi:[ribosomal protein S5]-alanine N-acetyltransferase
MAAERRVFLRAPVTADRDELAYLGGDTWPARQASGRSAAFVVCRRDDDAVVGVFVLSEISRGGFQSCCSHSYVHARFAGLDYMSEGFELLLRHVFRSMRLHRVEANIQPANTAAIALVRRAGFRLEGHSPRFLKIGGRWRDHERWAITRDDWLAR